MSYRSTASPGYTLNLPGFTRAVKVLIAVTCGVFVLQFVSAAANAWLISRFALWPDEVARGAVWQVVSYLFFHASLSHLFWNMLALWMFGVMVEEAIGSRRFYQLYFTCGIGGGLIDVAAHLLTHSAGSYTLGASGAIFGVLLATALLFPNREVFLLLPPVSIQMKWLVAIYGGLEFLFTLHATDNVSHFAHLGGMLFAFLFFKARLPTFRLQSKYERWKRRRNARRFEVYMSKRDRHTPPGGWTH